MANKPKMIFYKDKALYASGKDFVIRVSFDKTNGTYWLYKDGKRITSKTNKDDPDKALKNIATEFYKLVEKPNTVQIEQHHIQPQIRQKLKVIWLYIFDKDKMIQDYLLRFYGEECYLEAEEGEELITFKDMFEEDYDCQSVYKWDQILQARDYIKKVDKEYEPMIWNVNMTIGECYVIYNGVAPKEAILSQICDNLNHIFQFVNQQNREELKDSLFASGVVTPDRLEEGKSYWGEDVSVISEEDLDGYYRNIIYTTDGESISIVQNTIDKEFIVSQFVKLFKEDRHSTAALAEIPELLDILKDEISKPTKNRLAFDDILNAYKGRSQKPPSGKSIKDAENWLNEFLCICSAKADNKIKYVDEITDEQIDSYTTEIHKVATQPEYKYKASWLTEKQAQYLERQKKYPKLHWQKNRILMLTNLLTNAMNELTLNIEESTPVERVLFQLKQAKLIDETKQ